MEQNEGSQPKFGLVVDLGGGRSLEVQWSHREVIYWHPEAHGQAATLQERGVAGDHLREGTECIINVVWPLAERQETATSAVHPNDTYSRWLGRRVSLSHAMRAARGATGLSKTDRGMVWQAMRDRGW